MTYKTLRRKSDGQWMRYNYTCISEVTYPVPTPVSVGSKIDWSLYELVEVAVIPVDELPTLQECANYGIKKYEDNHKATYWLQGIRWFADKVGIHL